MLRQQKNRIPIALLVLLYQVADGVHEQTLAFDIAGVVVAPLPFAARWIG